MTRAGHAGDGGRAAHIVGMLTPIFAGIGALTVFSLVVMVFWCGVSDLTRPVSWDDHLDDATHLLAGQRPPRAPVRLLTEAEVSDMRTLGATLLRARVAGDTGAIKVLCATASPADMQFGLLLVAESLVAEVARLREVTPSAVAESFHHAALDMQFGPAARHDDEDDAERHDPR